MALSSTVAPCYCFMTATNIWTLVLTFNFMTQLPPFQLPATSAVFVFQIKCDMKCESAALKISLVFFLSSDNGESASSASHMTGGLHVKVEKKMYCGISVELVCVTRLRGLLLKVNF